MNLTFRLTGGCACCPVKVSLAFTTAPPSWCGVEFLTTISSSGSFSLFADDGISKPKDPSITGDFLKASRSSPAAAAADVPDSSASSPQRSWKSSNIGRGLGAPEEAEAATRSLVLPFLDVTSVPIICSSSSNASMHDFFRAIRLDPVAGVPLGSTLRDLLMLLLILLLILLTPTLKQ